MTADALTTTLFALADPTWRSIVARLAHGDATVNELAAPFDMSLAAVSKHIKVLESAGLVSRRKDAQYRPCHLVPAPLRHVAEWIDDYRRFWELSMDGLADYLKTMPRPPETKRAPRAAAKRSGRRTPGRRKEPR